MYDKKAIWLDGKPPTSVQKIQKKRHLYSRYQDNSHPAVKLQNKEPKKEPNRAKRKSEKKLAENIKSDIKSFYAYIRSLLVSRVKP